MGQLGEGSPQKSAEFKAKAVERAQVIGLTAAAKELGVPRSSLSRWIVDAGLDPVKVTKTSTARQDASLAAARATKAAKREEGLERVQSGLLAIAELGIRAEIDILRGERKVVKRINDKGEVVGFEHARLNEIVGSRTRAIHDLLLLSGDDTERINIRPDEKKVMAWRDDLHTRREAKNTLEAAKEAKGA